jgi:16S rRNA (cytidine1402-2'-O)-methyltransferase
MEDTGTLSVVATPIGNLEDITLRALRILQEADCVLCEDTRVTGRLLERHQINNTLRRYDAHTSETAHAAILDELRAGKHIALVSDAGTPGVSDPGVLLVERARTLGARVEVIPGPSALTAAVSLAGLTGNQFCFLGFAPQKKGRKTFFERLATAELPSVFFESTHRIMRAMAELCEVAPESKVYVARELTKLHEELLVGTPADIHAQLEREPVKQKGEFVIIVDAR